MNSATSSGGTFINAGAISLIGTQTFNTRGGNPEAGSAVIIGGSIDGGFLNAGPGTSNNSSQARTTAAGIEPRWHNMRDGVPSLYNIDALSNLPSDRIVYLVEGFTDTLTLTAHGFTAVGLVGAGGFREEWLAPLARFRVVAALDGDEAGQRASARYSEMFAARGMQLAQLKLPSDVNDFFNHKASAALEFELLTEGAIEEKQNTEFRSQNPE